MEGYEMAVLLEKMTNDALSLPQEDRAKLAHELIVSLDEHLDSDVSEAWENEICRRVKEIKEGTAKGRSAEQVLSEIKAQYQ